MNENEVYLQNLLEEKKIEQDFLTEPQGLDFSFNLRKFVEADESFICRVPVSKKNQEFRIKILNQEFSIQLEEGEEGGLIFSRPTQFFNSWISKDVKFKTGKIQNSILLGNICVESSRIENSFIKGDNILIRTATLRNVIIEGNSISVYDFLVDANIKANGIAIFNVSKTKID